MKHHCLLAPLVIGIMMTSISAAHAGDEDPATVQDAYTVLRDSGCEVGSIGVPLVARALRNVPYAQQGKIFKSDELTYLFQNDGGWYQPKSADADVLDADRACVRKLDAQEKKLRGKVKLKKPIEQVITRHAATVLDVARLVTGKFKKLRQAEKTHDGKRMWTLEFVENSSAALVTVTCMVPAAEAKAKPPVWTNLECHVLAAG